MGDRAGGPGTPAGPLLLLQGGLLTWGHGLTGCRGAPARGKVGQQQERAGAGPSGTGLWGPDAAG